MPRSIVASIAIALALGSLSVSAARANADLPRYPSISADGTTVAFTWRGDLWTVPAGGGTATRVTSHPADEVHSVFSPDGSRIAFTSTRDGAAGIYLMDRAGANIRHLTEIDRACLPTGFARNDQGNAVVTFHSDLSADVYREYRPYMIGLEGGDIRRVHDAFGSHPVFSPDNARVAFTRGGYYDRAFTRRHYRGAENADVWRYDRARNQFTQLTRWAGNDRSARWLDDRTLLFLSDRELNCVNLYQMDADAGEASVRRLTDFRDRDVQHFDVASESRRVVLSVWDTLYTLDLGGNAPRPVPMKIEASEDERDQYRIEDIGDDVSEAAVGPDGKVVALVAYGEIYVRDVAEDSPARRVTHGHARERDLAWSPDGRTLFFTSDRDGTDSIFAATVALTRGELKQTFTDATGQEFPIPPVGSKDPDADKDKDKKDPAAAGDPDADDAAPEDASQDAESEEDTDAGDAAARWRDAIRFDITPVAQRASNDRRPSPSPDGRWLAFRGTRGDVMLLELATGAMRPFRSGWDAGVTWQWSPDGRFLAYAESDLDFNRDIFIAPVDGSEPPVNITRHPDDDEEPRFSADGRILTFISERINEEYDVWMVALDKGLEALTAPERKAYYERTAKAAKKRGPIDPLDADDPDAPAADDDASPPWDLADAYLRVQRVTTSIGNETGHQLAPGGDRIVFAGGGDDAGVFSVKWDGSDRKRLSGSASVQAIDPTGEHVLLVASGRATRVPIGGGDAEKLDVADDIRVDLAAQSSQKFLEAARGLGEGYYHPTMNGVDWTRATNDYHDLARRTRTAEEFNWVANRFIGELNGSHLRITAPGDNDGNDLAYGRIGTAHRRAADGFEIISVLPHGPADQKPMTLAPGDVITAIEHEPLAPSATLEASLIGRVGKETVFTVRRGNVELALLLTPISWGAERQLKYRTWRRANAARVDAWSGGRLGYIHIQGMNQPSLDVFERDLFAAAEGKDGLLIDVRNNGGGWTTDRVLSSIMVRPHAYTIPRGADPASIGHYPQPRLFIQRYTLPTNLLCNEKSYSNAEIMSHAFKTLGRGTLVGQQTHGSVISTGGFSLIDGTWVRLPFRGWYVPDGTDMELHGAMPDLLVPQTPAAEARGDDEQLRAAVDDLMKRVE